VDERYKYLDVEENRNIEHKNGEKEVEGVCKKIKIDFEHRGERKK